MNIKIITIVVLIIFVVLFIYKIIKDFSLSNRASGGSILDQMKQGPKINKPRIKDTTKDNRYNQDEGIK